MIVFIRNPKHTALAEYSSKVLAWRRSIVVAVLVVILGIVILGGTAGFLIVKGRFGSGHYALMPIDFDALPVVETRAPPRKVWVSVDTAARRLRVYRGEELLRDMACSTGSGVRLRDEKGNREWMFDTPIGLRRVERKVRDPVWTKPDWAFIEEGQEPPPARSAERFDDISLGDYALYLGDGYLIHGTLFQSLIGQPVTHGCIRLGDEDLEYVYRNVPVGAPIYLY
jgi:L,D-transpeptidase YbiS